MILDQEQLEKLICCSLFELLRVVGVLKVSFMSHLTFAVGRMEPQPGIGQYSFGQKRQPVVSHG